MTYFRSGLSFITRKTRLDRPKWYNLIMPNAIQTIEGKATVVRPLRRDPPGPLTAMDILDKLSFALGEATSRTKNKAVGTLQSAQFELDVRGNENKALFLGLISTVLFKTAEKLSGTKAVINLTEGEIKPLAQIQRGSREATKLATLGETFLPNTSRAARAQFRHEVKGQATQIRQQADRTIDALMEQRLIGINPNGTIQCASDAIRALASKSIAILKANDDDLLTQLMDAKSIKARALSEMQLVVIGQDESKFAPLITDAVARSGEMQGLNAAMERISRSDVPNQAKILSAVKAKGRNFSNAERLLSLINL